MRSLIVTPFLLVFLAAPLALRAEVVKPPESVKRRDTAKAPAAPPIGNITFEASLEKAMDLGSSRRLVVVAYFTADWCGYCRKMETLCFPDQEVQSYAAKFVWVKIDIDREPVHAIRFGVRGVPAFGFLNIRGEILEVASGYRSPGEFVDVLEKNVDRIEAQGQGKVELDKAKKLVEQLKTTKTPEETEKAVLEVVAVLASPDRHQRSEVKAALIGEGRRVWPGLLSCFSDQRLAVRAAAFDLLSEASAQVLPFDAFAPLETRAAQLQAWTRWVRENAAPEPKKP